jgi:glutamyl-tRNA synthetase
MAPSPTGFFHVGSARTALFNWLFARQNDGFFILRIEDTDAERNLDDAREGIVTAMKWLGLDFDAGPFLQSELAAEHVASAEALYAQGYLYACDCTREQIDERIKGNAKPGYDGYCRHRHVVRSNATVLRFRVPDDGVTVVPDIIRGDVSFPHDSYEDFIVVRSNGGVLYPLANMVDDRSDAITHIIRGEDLLPTTPKQVMMWEALNHCPDVAFVPHPLYAHLPMLVNEQRKKLSKRKDPVAVESYRDQGYLADAFVNYLGLLGWSPPNDEAEVFTRDEMVRWFALADVNHSPAFFDVAKLTHMNGEYIRAMAPGEFIEACRPWLEGDGVPWPAASFDEAAFRAMAPVVQERVAVLGEVPGMVDFLFLDAPVIDPDSWQKALAGDEAAPAILAAATTAYEALDGEWTAGALHAATLGVAESMGRKLGKAQAPIRVAVTGRRVGPPLFEALEVLGPDRTLARLADAAARLAAGGPVPT